MNNADHQGTLAEWNANVGDYCTGNPLLTFCVCIPFAAPLLNWVMPSGSAAVNLVGKSSSGKSTTQDIAQSVQGDPEPRRSWHQTACGIEAVCSLHRDMALILDELARVDARDAARIVYLLAGQTSKGRMTKLLETNPLKDWRCIVLSSGNHGLADKLAENHEKISAALSVRFIDLNIPSTGMFIDLHDFPTGAKFAKHLQRQARKFYGTPVEAFLTRFCADLEADETSTVTDVQEWMDRFTEEVLTKPGWWPDDKPWEVDGEVERVADLFAIIAAGGQCAQEYSVVNWPVGWASECAKRAFEMYLEQRGHVQAMETQGVIRQMVDFVEANWKGRETEWHDDNWKTLQRRMGSWKTVAGIGKNHFLTVAGFREGIQGFNFQEATVVLRDAGILEWGTETTKVGNHSTSKPVPYVTATLPDGSRYRAYKIVARGLNALAPKENVGTVPDEPEFKNPMEEGFNDC